MNLQDLVSVKNFKKAKRVGRGESSGKGKTSGKGYKGQKVRGKVKLGFEGGQLRIIKRLPFKRGVGNNLKKESLTLTLTHLNVFDAGETVNAKTLTEKGLIKKADRYETIKIVASGSLEKALKIEVATTKEAKKLIEKAKGDVLVATKKEENPKDAS